MTTKKILLIVGGVVLVLAVVAGSFVVAIVGLGLYGVRNSESAEKAKDYLRRNEKLKQDIGEVKEFGAIVPAKVNFESGNNEVSLKLKVVGERKTVSATVDLVLVQGNAWRVTSASYVNTLGENIPLLDPYETKAFPLLAA